jgi:rhomboid protease GluP
MTYPPDSWIVVFSGRSERECAELGLMLAARGIPHQYAPAAGGWQLVVPGSAVAAAHAEIMNYLKENQPRPAGRRRLDVIDNGWIGVGVYVVVLAAVAAFAGRMALGLDWLGAGNMHAARVQGGELWRTVTALMLHVELGHLVGNMVFGSFFGLFVARHLGSGLGWAAIVASGLVGNLLNALIQAGTHRAIGASTAVFGALGLLVAYTWRAGFLRGTPWKERIAPVVAGIGLLAFTGTGGENTDIIAHLTGFIAGFVFGVLLARVKIPREPRVQLALGGGTLGVLLLSWVLAFAN